jgi:ubiquinone biosynthesis monooxygenase Coq7
MYSSPEPPQPLLATNRCDVLLALAGRALGTLTASLPARRALPTAGQQAGTGHEKGTSAANAPQSAVTVMGIKGLTDGRKDTELGATDRASADGLLLERERKLSGALMRVNHVGEVCAQALYEGHALATKDPSLRQFFRASAQEEADHLAWTRERLEQLGERPSFLNPLWYTGALGLGYLAGWLGDRTSLGFMQETERQVEAHLAAHLQRLPERDHVSRAIVQAMEFDEAAHAKQAALRGARELPTVVKQLMRGAARLMTGTAHII